VLVRPQDACQVADAVVRLFIDHGDRTDRTKARLKYVLDAMGIEKFVALLEEKLGRKFDRGVPGALAPRPAFSRTAHIGIQPQRQEGLHWIGVVLPVGRMTVAQMRGLAEIARELGDGDLRLTVWQNLLVSGVPTERLAAATERIVALGLAIETNAIRAGLVACTGNTGCKFAASDTKRHAEEIARWCETRIALDTPVNIHLTGCHHSCAQHFVSEIGLLACKVQKNEDDDPVEGYHVLVGGGFGPDAALGRELYRDVVAEDAPRTVARILKAYLAHRASRDETFLAFSRRHDAEALKAMAEAEAAE
jgi:ferredoxin-nitrite reductase